jgi:hypothetical protein
VIDLYLGYRGLAYKHFQSSGFCQILVAGCEKQDLVGGIIALFGQEDAENSEEVH